MKLVSSRDFVAEVSELVGKARKWIDVHGVIMCRCKNFNLREMQKLYLELKAVEPKLEFALAMEENTGMFAIVLKHKNLSETHFFGILLREFLMNRGWVESPILIAAFPAEGSTDGILAAMAEELKRSAGKEAPIWLYGSDVGKTYSLLIIDSDPYVRELLETRFVLKGYRVNTAQDGQSGWQLYEELLPELVIMDIHLPMVNGFQILQRIQRSKHHGENKSGKILVLSGKRVVEDVSRCFALGADDYMTKPFSPGELEARVQKLLAAE